MYKYTYTMSTPQKPPIKPPYEENEYINALLKILNLLKEAQKRRYNEKRFKLINEIENELEIYNYSQIKG